METKDQKTCVQKLTEPFLALKNKDFAKLYLAQMKVLSEMHLNGLG
ncbi:hypothetical protein [Chryseobacterium geocarposphaerae]|nr:hypothetical protein [Chryseobacterium geocarposphaerae]